MSRVNLNISESEAMRMYYNYYYGGNTNGYSAADIGAIVTKFGKRKVSSWQKSAENRDNNAYEITNSDYNKYFEEGRRAARNASGYTHSNFKTYGRAIGDATLATGGRIAAKYGIRKGSELVLRKVAEKGGVEITKRASEEILKASTGELSREALGLLPVGQGIKKFAEKGAEETGVVIGREVGEDVLSKTFTETTTNVVRDTSGNIIKVNGEKVIEQGGEKILKKTGQKVVEEGEQVTLQKSGEQVVKEAAETAKCVSVIASCLLDGTFATLYRTNKPNEDENNAVKDYTENIGSQQAILASTSQDMARSESKVNNYAKDACNRNEAANSAIEKNMSNYSIYACQIEHYDSAITRGYQLSDDEKKVYQSYLEEMGKLGENIGEEQVTAQEEVSGIRYVMESEQGAYQQAAKNIAMNQGFNAEVSEVDESTAMSAKIEAVAQGISAAQSTKDATMAGIEAASIISGSGWFFGAGFVAALPVIAASVVAAGAAVSDGFAVSEQLEISNNAENLTAGRQQTEAMNEVVSADYDQKIDDFDMNLDVVDELYLEVPDENELNPNKKKK